MHTVIQTQMYHYTIHATHVYMPYTLERFLQLALSQMFLFHKYTGQLCMTKLCVRVVKTLLVPALR